MAAPPGEPVAVVVDTGVYGAGLSRKSEPLAARYARHLVGRRLVLSFQTVAELRFGALNAGWGTRKRADLEVRLARAAVVGVDDALASAYAQLRHACVQAGHALGGKHHAGGSVGSRSPRFTMSFPWCRTTSTSSTAPG